MGRGKVLGQAQTWGSAGQRTIPTAAHAGGDVWGCAQHQGRAAPSARPGSVPAAHPPEMGLASEQLWAASESATGRAGQCLIWILPYGRAVLAFALHLVQFDSGNPAVVFYPIREDVSRVCSVTQSMLFSLWKKKYLLNNPALFCGCGERKLRRDWRRSTVRGTLVLR